MDKLNLAERQQVYLSQAELLVILAKELRAIRELLEDIAEGCNIMREAAILEEKR